MRTPLEQSNQMRAKIGLIDSLYLYSDLSAGQIAKKVEMSPGEVQKIIDNLVRKDALEAISEQAGMPVRNIMRRDVAVLDSSMTAIDAANLMIQKGTGCVIVTSHGRPFGVVTEKDLLCESTVFGKNLGDLLLGVIASRPLVSTPPLETVGNVSDIMLRNNIHRVPVVEDGKLVGMVVARDIAMLLSSKRRHALGQALLEAISRPRSD